MTGVNALVGDLHPELKKQLVDVVERQFVFHPDTAFLVEDLQCFPRDIFLEIIDRTNKNHAQISPTLINLLKKMSGIHEAPTSPDRLKEKEFSSKDMETLLKREEYEHYVPEEYDRLLKRASEASSNGGVDESQFPLQEHLKTLTYEHVDFQICQLLHSLMDERIEEEDYLACSRKLATALPDLLKADRFSFLTTVMETLRRHVRETPSDTIRQKAQFLLRSLTEKGSVAKRLLR